MDDAGGEGLQHRPHPLQQLGVAPDHDREGSRLDPGDVARHRAIEEPGANGVDGTAHLDDRVRTDRAGVEGDSRGTDSGDDPVGAEVDIPHRLIVGEAGDDHLGVRRRLSSRGHDLGTGGGADTLRLGGVAAPYDGVEAGAPDGGRHRAPHSAHADHRH